MTLHAIDSQGMEPDSAVASYGLVREVPNMEVDASLDDDNPVADHTKSWRSWKRGLKVIKRRSGSTDFLLRA